MGERIDSDTWPVGDTCEFCEANSYDLFPAGRTPETICVRFAGLELCDNAPEGTPLPPNDKRFELTQRDDYPCSWYGESGAWYVDYAVAYGDPPGTYCQLFNADVHAYYFLGSNEDPPCSDRIDNACSCSPPVFVAHEGYVIADWKRIPIGVASRLNIEPADTLFSELRGVEDSLLVDRLADRKRSIKIHVLLDPAGW